ncbi:MAG: (Fe-S)-binding protein, partial [Candidatus Electrothrix sp. EH2]|nr:(Fe-S)-binding protein [Candidatus Electrothrix sp. EH2]
LFPGCTVTVTHPARLLELFRHLRRRIPGLGIVLSCCSKPSHDLGRQNFFMNEFDILKQTLIHQGVRRVLVLCPSCHTVFSRYGSPLQTEYVYTLLAEHSLPKKYITNNKRKFLVHDPCTARLDIEIHNTVRKLLYALVSRVEEPASTKEKTICCGEGGAVACINTKLARNWGDRRSQEAEGRVTVTYCAGCVHFLRSRMRIIHLLDLLFDPEAALAGKIQIARPPFTYLNRLLLKRRLKKLLP